MQLFNDLQIYKLKDKGFKLAYYQNYLVLHFFGQTICHSIHSGAKAGLKSIPNLMGK